MEKIKMGIHCAFCAAYYMSAPEWRIICTERGFSLWFFIYRRHFGQRYRWETTCSTFSTLLIHVYLAAAYGVHTHTHTHGQNSSLECHLLLLFTFAGAAPHAQWKFNNINGFPRNTFSRKFHLEARAKRCLALDQLRRISVAFQWIVTVRCLWFVARPNRRFRAWSPRNASDRCKWVTSSPRI